MSKRKGGHTAYRLLEQHYPLIARDPEALRPPRPLVYLPRLSASLMESCQGKGLHLLQGLDEVTSAMARVGRALATCHQSAAAGASGGMEAGGRRSHRQAHRSPAHARAAELMNRAEARLPESEDVTLCLMKNIRLHEVVLDSGEVGLTGVHELYCGDPTHDVASLLAAWRLQGIVSDDTGASAAAVDAFVRAYEETRGRSLRGLRPFEAHALAEQACHLSPKSSLWADLLDLAEARLVEPE